MIIKKYITLIFLISALASYGAKATEECFEKFPWKKLKKNQLGIWYRNFKIRSKKLNNNKLTKLFFNNLFKIGYRYFDRNKRSKKDIFVVKAFQRRFLPHKVTGVIDQNDYIISHFLASQSKK